MSLTISDGMVLMKAVRERLADLKRLRTEVSTRTLMLYGENEKKITEPQYDVKRVDAKITELEMFIFKTDMAIKKANATTTLNIDFNADKLLEPLS